jgi:hypothetical protein
MAQGGGFMARHFSRRGLLLGGAGSGLLLAAGCDLLELAQNPYFNVKLPPRTYTLSTNDPAWKSPPAFFTTAAVSCTNVASCCPPPGLPPGVVSPADCASVPIICQDSICGVGFPLEVFNTVNLATEAPELANAKGAVSEITLESLQFKITNQVGADFPPVRLYIAPATTMTATGAGVQLIGETPVAPKDIVTMKTIDTPAAARTAFAMYARNVMTPFNFIASTNVAILSGAPAPKGQVLVEVTGTIKVKL